MQACALSSDQNSFDSHAKLQRSFVQSAGVFQREVDDDSLFKL
jgi:hypothetical protein